MDLDQLMRAGIDAAPATEDGALQLSGAVAAAAASVEAAAARLGEARDLEQELLERKQRWIARGQTMQAEAAAERQKLIRKLLAGSSKASLEELSQTYV